MKKTAIYTSLFILIISQISCTVESIRASDQISTVSYSFSNYNALEISNDFNAFITFSNVEEKIEIKANDNLHQHIIVQMSNGKLSIKLKNGINIKGKEILDVYIKTKNLTEFKASNDSHITLENKLVTQNTKIELFGDSKFEGEVNLSKLKISAKGDSKIDIYGNVDDLDVSLQGDSEFYDYDLLVKELKIKLSGDSNAFLSVSKSIDIEASGDSYLYYKGTAGIIFERLTGSSRVIKK